MVTHDPAAPARAALEAALADTAPLDTPLPTGAGGWGMAGDTLTFLARLVPRFKPRHMMEFGGGLSTRLLAGIAATMPQCVLSSIDHDPEFGGLAYDKLRDEPAHMRRVRPQIAPLVARDCGGKMLPQYRIQARKLASRRPADLIIVDGPPVLLGGREGALFQAMDYARPGSIILLDDAARESEVVALRQWGEIMREAVEVRQLPGFCKGLTAVIVREPVPREELWPRRLECSARDLREFDFGGARVLVAGENWWREAVAGCIESIPFTEHDGHYYGPPADGASAVAELKRQRESGSAFLIVGAAFSWWLDFYPELREHLRTRVVLENDRLSVFSL